MKVQGGLKTLPRFVGSSVRGHACGVGINAKGGRLNADVLLAVLYDRYDVIHGTLTV